MAVGQTINQMIETDYYHYSSAYDALNEFLFNNPRFKNRKIINHSDEIKNNPFYDTSRFYLYDSFVVECSTTLKQWIVAVKSHHRYNFSKVYMKRFYKDGIPSRKRRRVIKAKIHSIEESFKSMNTKNDCQIRTLTAITGLSYDIVLEEMRKRGWDEKNVGTFLYANGLKNFRYKEILAMNNYVAKEIWNKFNLPQFIRESDSIFKDKKGFTVKTLVKVLPKGRFIITVNEHVLAIIDNKLYDSWNSSNKRVIKIIEVTKKEKNE